MKVLVTGAAGFIGFYLIKALIEQGYEVVGLDNLNDYYDVNLKLSRLAMNGINTANPEIGAFIQSETSELFRFVKMDLTDREGINRLFETESFDIVCHLAAQAGVRYSIENPAAYIESNIVGFFNVLEAARTYPPKHFVYASSSSVYGLSDKFPYSETDRTDEMISLYAATKKSDELMAYTYAHLYKLRVTGVRFFTVYGPWGRPDMAPMLFMKAIVNGNPIKVYNNGNLMRDFTYVEDIVEGLLRIIPSPSIEKVPSRVYNIGSSSPVALMDFIHTIEEVTGKEAIKNFMEMQPGDVLKTYADVSRLKEDFNYHPTTSLKEGMQKLFNWYKEYYS